jgi:hypothetical protein
MWLYQGKQISSYDDLPKVDGLVGFVYRITNLRSGQIYIGKKNFFSKRKKNLTKKELATITDKRLKKYKHVVKESDWMKYWGSNDDLQLDVVTHGETFFRREIIGLATSTKALSYLEVKYQFIYPVLEDESYNGNILGKFYKKDMSGIVA